MTALLQNFVGGSLNATLSAAGTVMASLALESVRVVESPDTLTIVLDPDGIAGAPEIVVITDHAFGANTATITRGKEATVIREHKSGTNWVHSMTVGLFESVVATGSSGTGSGVTTQASAPPSPGDYELWLDTDEPAPVTDPLQVVPSLLVARQFVSGTYYTKSNTTAAAIDAGVFATGPFVVPDSGSVIVEVSFAIDSPPAETVVLTLMDGSTNLGDRRVAYQVDGQTRPNARWIVTGLTPGETEDYDFGVYITGSNPVLLLTDATHGGAQITVHDAATSQGTVIQATGYYPNLHQYRCTMTPSANVTGFASATETLVPLGTAHDDPLGMANTSTSRITIPVTGLWMVSGSVSFQGNSTAAAYSATMINRNGPSSLTRGIARPTINGSQTLEAPSRAVHLTAGDYIDMQFRATEASAGSLQINPGVTSTFLNAALIAPEVV